jgi:hypothetical protein
MSRSAARRQPEEIPAIDEIVGRIGDLLQQLVERQPARLSVLQVATLAHEARRKRRTIFGAREISDTSWDILLDLFIARFEKRRVTVKSACLAAGAPMTTAIRYITHLESIGLLTRSRNPNDARSSFLHISDRGVRKLTEHFSETLKAAETLYE